MKLVFVQGEKTCICTSKGFDKEEIINKMKSIGWKLKEEENQDYL